MPAREGIRCVLPGNDGIDDGAEVESLSLGEFDHGRHCRTDVRLAGLDSSAPFEHRHQGISVRGAGYIVVIVAMQRVRWRGRSTSVPWGVATVERVNGIPPSTALDLVSRVGARGPSAAALAAV